MTGARHGMDAAWARHDMCELVFNVLLEIFKPSQIYKGLLRVSAVFLFEGHYRVKTESKVAQSTVSVTSSLVRQGSA